MGQLLFSTTTLGKTPGVFVIAEVGVNHDGDVEQAVRYVEAAASCGADAVKFQTFKASKLAAVAAPMADYQSERTTDESQVEMLRRLELDVDAHRKIMEACEHHDILFLSTPFDAESAHLLADLSVPAFKVSSGDLGNLPFLRELARLGRPLILSTGMSSIGEVEAAVLAVEESGQSDFVLLHCVSNYPADVDDVNLRAMDTLRSFGYRVGYSDHTLGLSIPIAAVARGATVIEKHFTFDRTSPGPDHHCSLEPEQMSMMVAGIREVERALGDGRKRPAASEEQMAAVARKSLVARRDLPVGHIIQADDLVIKRPGTGIPPVDLDHVVGLALRRAVSADYPILWDDFKALT